MADSRTNIKHRYRPATVFTGAHWLAEMAVLVLCGLIAVVAIKTWLIEPFAIPSDSMAPTLVSGDRIFVSKTDYEKNPPSVGDIVVFSDPEGSGRKMVKRVVATAGMTVDIMDDRITVDGEALDPPVGTQMDTGPRNRLEYPVTLSDGEMFLIGDNPAKSRDSRAFGPVDSTQVAGRVIGIYWPVHRATSFGE